MQKRLGHDFWQKIKEIQLMKQEVERFETVSTICTIVSYHV